MNKVQPSPAAIAWGELLLALHQRPRTKAELMEITGVGRATLLRMMLVLQRRRLIYIESWVKHGTVLTAKWAYGYLQDDAPRPAPLTHADHSRNYRIRLKKEVQHAPGFVRHISDTEDRPLEPKGRRRERKAPSAPVAGDSHCDGVPGAPRRDVEVRAE